ncbi:hypothetical protein PHISCL_01771 [Aspergillus sclerotialis]|uniref:N-acetyltransferase domain-containing protein n=1 Tax=Aspergillus sclerotialis TaxID=2070753 RepID=A0A3A3A2F6_9EURO|nr:hypothetical protein PHISCL_01771 [Aspergillus sclerotialis]
MTQEVVHVPSIVINSPSPPVTPSALPQRTWAQTAALPVNPSTRIPPNYRSALPVVRMPPSVAKSDHSSDCDEVVFKRSRQQTGGSTKKRQAPTSPVLAPSKSVVDVPASKVPSPAKAACVENDERSRDAINTGAPEPAAQPSAANLTAPRPVRTVIPEESERSKDATQATTPDVAAPAQKAKKPPVMMKKDPYEPAPKEVYDEIARLSKPILEKAHANRFQEVENPAFPEMLPKLREGAGTVKSSERYAEIESFRNLPNTVEKVDGVPHITIFRHSDMVPGRERFAAQWRAYKEDTRGYPTIKTDGTVYISSHAPPGMRYVAVPRAERRRVIHKKIGAMHAPENKWAEAMHVDWEYRPSMCSNYPAFRDNFRKWLDISIENVGEVDIYHQSFFDGSAHSDGVGWFFIGDFEHEDVILDPEDEAARLHNHETSLGYMINFDLYVKELEYEARAKKIREREAYTAALKKLPKSDYNLPRLNVYFRPVEEIDARNVAHLMNWYMENSSQSIDEELITPEIARERMTRTLQFGLPFIVAVERRSPGRGQSPSAPEKIVGYASATDINVRNCATRYTVKLNIFVHHGWIHKGIGKCLMDKLLEFLDMTHKPKHGYYYEEPNTVCGGGRKIRRLMFEVPYPSDDRASCERVIDWLKKYDFEEQGVLKGIAVKFDR